LKLKTSHAQTFIFKQHTHSQATFKPIQSNLSIEKGKTSLTSIEEKESFVKMEEKKTNFGSKGGVFLHSNNKPISATSP